jgi:hypothetical protein
VPELLLLELLLELLLPELLLMAMLLYTRKLDSHFKSFITHYDAHIYQIELWYVAV